MHHPQMPDFFDTLAPRWDELTAPSHARMTQVLDRIPLEPGLTVLDVGCGTGRTVRYLLDRLGPAGRVVALDRSRGMLDLLRRQVHDRRVEPVLGDVEGLPERITGLDLVLLFDVLPHLRAPERVLPLLASRLAPGGRLVVAHDVGREELKDLHRAQGRSVEADVLPANSVLVDLFRRAGLQVEEPDDRPDSFLLVGRRESAPPARMSRNPGSEDPADA